MRYTAFLLHAHTPKSFLTRYLSKQLIDQLCEKVQSPRDDTEIDLVIHSPGGDAHAAYKLAIALRSFASRWRIVIPDYAKSAATLLALGADEIVMSPWAELGPLDVQLEHPDREGVTVSGLDMIKSIRGLSREALASALSGGAGALEITELSRQVVLREMLEFSARLLAPVSAKIDPHLVIRAGAHLQVAVHYGQRLLKRRNLANGEKLPDSEATALAQLLVNNYPDHGSVIDREEAKELGLPVVPMESYEFAQMVFDVLNEHQETSEPVFMVLAPGEVEDNEEEQNAEQGPVSAVGASAPAAPSS